MSSYQYRKSHCGDKTVVRSFYLQNGISYTGKMTSLYWIRALLWCSMGSYNLVNLSCVTTAKTVQCPAITWVSDVLVSVEHTGANFSEIWNEILSEKISFKMSSARWQPLWVIHNVFWYYKSSDSKNEEFWLDFTCEEKRQAMVWLSGKLCMVHGILPICVMESIIWKACK